MSNHKALKSEVLESTASSGCEFKLVQLQDSKTDKRLTLHACPSSYTIGGDAQVADLLYFLGLHRGDCPFFNQVCLSTQVSDSFDLESFSRDFGTAFTKFASACKLLRPCGIVLPKPESASFFTNQPTSPDPGFVSMGGGDGHRANESKRLKEALDEHFNYVFTWLVRDREKGWVTHYLPKNNDHVAKALKFIGLETFPECPEFGFEPCYWRFLRAAKESRSSWDNGAREAHSFFDETATQFSEALLAIQDVNSLLTQHGLHLWEPPPPSAPVSSNNSDLKDKEDHATVDTAPTCFISYSHDSETHKGWVRGLANDLQNNGVEVTLDQWELKKGDAMTHFMENAVTANDFVLMICTPKYAEKANARDGGVGYESSIISAQIYNKAKRGKFVPIKRASGKGECIPTFLKDKLRADFSDDSKYQENLTDILRHLHDKPEHIKPPLGPPPAF